MWEFWWVFALLAVILLGFAAFLLPRVRRRNDEETLRNAQGLFHRQREWLEARFVTMAERSGKPRGLRWANCDFEDDVSFARDRLTGRLRALVAVSIKFEAIEGGDMEEVEAVENEKAATVVFRLDGPEWEADGQAVFNLSPSQTIERFQNELETVDES